MARAFDTMREVVAWLQIAGAGAIKELKDVDAALGEICFALSGVCETATALASDAQSEHATVNEDRSGEETLAHRVAHQSAAMADIAHVTAALHRVVQSWGMSGLREPERDEGTFSSSINQESVAQAGVNQIVDELHRGPSEALRELQALEQALNEIWQVLSPLGDITSGLAADLQNAPALEPAAFESFKNRAQRTAEMTGQVTRAFEEICRAVRSWGVAERGPSNRPRSSIATPLPFRHNEKDSDGR